MVKTQVQIPEELYRRAKEIAKEREISFAEVMRRGLEYMSRTHPSISAKKSKLPVIEKDRFMDNLDDFDLKGLSASDEVKPLGS